MKPICGDCRANSAIRRRRVYAFPEFDASATFPSDGSMTRRLASLHRVPSRSVPRLPRYYRDAPTPAPPSHRARCLRPAVPLVASSVSLPSALDARPGARKFRVRHSQADFAKGEGQASQVPGEPHCACARFSDPGGIDFPKPLRRVDAAPGPFNGVGSREKTHFEAQWPGYSHSLSTLRRVGCPTATQDSLPAAGYALPDGIGYPQGSNERFQKMRPTPDPPFPSFAWRNKPGF